MRTPHKFPKLNIIKKFEGQSIQDQLNYLETLELKDLNLENYVYDNPIKADMIA
jgi:thymidylate synthase